MKNWMYGLLLVFLVLLMMLGSMRALAYDPDRSHCGPDGFSPQAPPEACQVHQVPEPSTLLLLGAALAAARVARRKR